MRGIWRRVDHIAIPARAGKLYPTCTRHGAGYCRHVGALLLHWVRSSESFDVAIQFDYAGSVEPPSMPAEEFVRWGSGRSEFLEAELADLLDAYTIDELRKLAQRRGFRAKGIKKLDVVSDVAAGLADPCGIDLALASLSPAERSALDTIDLICAEHPVHDESIQSAFKLLGGTGTPRPADLANLGLAVSVDGYYHSSPGYVVPYAVSARLPLLDHLAEPSQEDEPPGASRDHSLGIEEMLQVVALSALAGDIGPSKLVYEDSRISLPLGLIRGPDTGNQTHLLVAHASMDEAALEQLSSRTGQSGAFVDFAARLMFACDILHRGPVLAIRKDRLQELLDLPPSARRARLIDAWLKTAGPVELGYSHEQDSPIRIYWRVIERSWSYPLIFPVTDLIRLTLRLLSRMTPDRWNSLDSFTATYTQLLPSALPQLNQFRRQLSNHQNLKIARMVGRNREKRLSLRNDEEWESFVSGLVATILNGPLKWLGLVDIHRSNNGSNDFRVLPVAGILAGREVPSDAGLGRRRAIVHDDMTVAVPAGTTDVSVHSLLARIGELSGALSGGLSYRLTASGFHSAFEAGMTGPDIANLLVEQNGEPLPSVVAEAINRWWQGYGSTRLYDEMCLIELTDDVAQTELLAATPLAASLVHVFSPRLMAIDPSHVDSVVAMLTDRGYAPRVIEED